LRPADVRLELRRRRAAAAGLSRPPQASMGGLEACIRRADTGRVGPMPGGQCRRANVADAAAAARSALCWKVKGDRGRGTGGVARGEGSAER